jgi:hypothetical protein
LAAATSSFSQEAAAHLRNSFSVGREAADVHERHSEAGDLGDGARDGLPAAQRAKQGQTVLARYGFRHVSGP